MNYPPGQDTVLIHVGDDGTGELTLDLARDHLLQAQAVGEHAAALVYLEGEDDTHTRVEVRGGYPDTDVEVLVRYN